jgi:hypothetical protein
MTYHRTFVTHVSCSESNLYNFTTTLINRHFFLFGYIWIQIPQDSGHSEMVGLVAWNAASSLVRSDIVVDREDLDLGMLRHIPGHHSYLKDLEVTSSYHRSIDLANNPSTSVVERRRR